MSSEKKIRIHLQTINLGSKRLKTKDKTDRNDEEKHWRKQFKCELCIYLCLVFLPRNIKCHINIRQQFQYDFVVFLFVSSVVVFVCAFRINHLLSPISSWIENHVKRFFFVLPKYCTGQNIKFAFAQKTKTNNSSIRLKYCWIWSMVFIWRVISMRNQRKRWYEFCEKIEAAREKKV